MMLNSVAYNYTLDPETDEPIMMLDTHIGMDEKEGMGIDGALFAAELYNLAKTKERVKVYINSVGGSLVHAMQIYNAVLDAPCKVDTYNIGIALSSAGCIFQAGRKRYAYDYSQFMMHPVQGASGSAEAALNKSVIGMLSRKTNKSQRDIEMMMKRTTWLTAAECLESNLCDEVINSADKNKPKLAAMNSVSEMWLAARNSFNLTPTKINKMKDVTNRLGLTENASESEILLKITAIENKATEAENKANDLQTKLDAAEAKATEATNKLTEIETAANAAKLEALATEAKTAVEAAKNLGKITGDENVINAWIEDYKKDPESTKLKLGSLAVNKQGVNLSTEVQGNNNVPKAGSFAATELIRVQAKLMTQDLKQ